MLTKESAVVVVDAVLAMTNGNEDAAKEAVRSLTPDEKIYLIDLLIGK